MLPQLMSEGSDYQLTCDIISVAPVQNLRVTWLHGSEVMETQTFNETATTPVNVSSVINVTAKAAHNGGFFLCRTELDLGPNGPKPPTTSIGLASTVVHCEFPPLFGRIRCRHACKC